MYEKIEKPKENKSRVVANSVAQKKSSAKQGFGFVDNRSDAITQRKLQHDLGRAIQNKSEHKHISFTNISVHQMMMNKKGDKAPKAEAPKEDEGPTKEQLHNKRDFDLANAAYQKAKNETLNHPVNTKERIKCMEEELNGRKTCAKLHPLLHKNHQKEEDTIGGHANEIRKLSTDIPAAKKILREAEKKAADRKRQLEALAARNAAKKA